MKVDLSKDVLDTWGYDRDNGVGAAKGVISELRKTQNVNTETIQDNHARGVELATEIARSELFTPSVITKIDANVVVIKLGNSDLSDKLTDSLNKLENKGL